VHRNGKIDKGYFRNGYFVRYIEDWLLDNYILWYIF
jgi:hypothetical protein